MVRQTAAGRRNIVVVGATGTVGSAVARAVVARGDRVWLVARDATRLGALAASLGDATVVRSSALDLANPDGASRLAADAMDATDLVFALGSFPRTPIATITREEIAAQAIEQCALFVETVRALADAIGRAHGAAVGFGDDGVERPYPNHLAYLAGKGALTAAARALALELGRHPAGPVRVGVVTVGVVTDPEMTNPARAASLAARSRLGRTGTPEEIAHVALAMIDATFATGEAWGVGR